MRPNLTVSEIVEQFEVSLSTVRRKIKNNEFKSAERDATGAWRIPIEDLSAAGLKPRKTWLVEDGKETSEAGDGITKLAEALHRIEILELRLEHEKQLRDAAELNASDLRNSFLMIEGQKSHDTVLNSVNADMSHAHDYTADTVTKQVKDPAKKRSFWRF